MAITPQIQRITPQIPTNAATVLEIGSAQLATGGGHLAGPPVVQVAGSADAIATLYDGTSTSGVPLGSFSLATVGATSISNISFGALFVAVTGTTAGRFTVTYTGPAA